MSSVPGEHDWTGWRLLVKPINAHNDEFMHALYFIGFLLANLQHLRIDYIYDMAPQPRPRRPSSLPAASTTSPNLGILIGWLGGENGFF